MYRLSGVRLQTLLLRFCYYPQVSFQLSKEGQISGNQVPEIIKHISPIISFKNYSAMFRIEPELKRNNRLIIECIKRSWPELLELPVNKYGDYRDGMIIFQKLLNPAKVSSKFRKLLAR